MKTDVLSHYTSIFSPVSDEYNFISLSVTPKQTLIILNIFSCVWTEPYEKDKNSGALVRQRSIPTERPPLVGEVSANFSG
jgi:hypothetical protein